MRQRILGAIGVFWGGGILVSRLLRGNPVDGAGAYATGQAIALVLAVLLIGVGGYYLLRKQPGK